MIKILLMVTMCSILTAYSFVPEHNYNPTLLSIYPDWHRICLMITGTTEELIQQTKKGIFPDDDSIKRYNDCVWTHHNFVVGTDRVLNMEKIKYLLPKGWDNVADALQKCNHDLLKSGEKDETKFFWKLHRCYHDNVEPSQYFFL